jgi:hypothetical protein
MSLPAPVAVPQTNPDMGLVCVITNEKGVKSHAFGTYHYSDQETIQKSYFHQIIGNCSSLYTEVGELPIVGPDWGDRREYSDLTYRFNLDAAITRAAFDQHIHAISLDADIPAEAETMRQIGEDRARFGEKNLLENFMQNARKMENNPIDVLIHNSIKNGDQRVLLIMKERLKNSPISDENTIREEHWAEQLTPVLNNTDTPVCIAVGALHLVGEGGLADRFKKAGLKVEFIQHHAPAPNPSASWTSRVAAKLTSLKGKAAEGISQIFNTSQPTACKATLH